MIAVVCFVLVLPSPTTPQVTSFDFLTYNDQSHISDFTYKRWKIACYFFIGTNEFDEDGKASSDEVSFLIQYIYASYRLYNSVRLKINVAGKMGAAMTKEMGIGLPFTPWIWVNLKPIGYLPVSLRLAYGKMSNRSVSDREIEVALLYRQRFSSLALESSVGYRAYRQDPIPHIPSIQDGDEIHYKAESFVRVSENRQLSFFIMGYRSGNRKYQGRAIPNSHSHKAALGTSLAFRKVGGTIFTFGLLWDFYGRDDKKGWAILFNMAK